MPGTGGRRLIGMAMRKTPDDVAEQAVDDDSDIRAVLRANDVRGALTLMMNRYGDQVYRLAYAMTRSRHLAEEVRQQVFVEAYRDLSSFAGHASLRAWVLGIARHRCLDIAKKQRRWTNRFKNEPPPDEEPDHHEPERELDRSRLAKILAVCLARLAPAARDAVVLRYHQDLSYDEASAIAGDNAGTLQQRVARALPALRRCVDARLNVGSWR
jgi:RNA polymerase sigma-70 factor, ECF subfamily